jgi:hypothetical protein
MNSVRYFLLLIFSIIIYACSSSVETTANKKVYPESSIKTNNLIVNIPDGWREISDNDEKLFEIWLVNKENTAVICFIPITVNNQIEVKTETEKLDILEKILTTKRTVNADKFEVIESTELDSDYLNRQIKFSINNKIQNSILFGKDKYFYECLAYFDNTYFPSSNQLNTLFETQRVVVINSKIETQK